MFTHADRASDAALVEGLTLGDHLAAAAFVRRFQSAVFGLALSITRDSSMAEDVSQEAFVRAWRAAATFDPRRASALTWLLTITRNAAIDAVRMRRTVPTDGEALERLIHGTLNVPDPTDTTLHRLEAEAAIRRLNELAPEQARAVILAVIAGCPAADVSRHEGIPLGTAKTRIRTGLRRMRELLEEHHD
ncbi:sigma-70 family RNA polymerase sigma factor [Actinobacteria bacterium YIM 96077]|uniref:RNA polymerase subunit sigma-70 n=1 Tax=Phytoactinopolyspora halophila TaxID=1981511 RepID=A0A329QTP0_9ACTN|nr:sigma-70 family RNA polymerase sigma factor [Phytoactinopolyspora halophila]AYY14535.1 sigma-70 family RNA polymerase sigma factor [Actinobacteria bacterium YIM 96077]RAW14088.1 RNA polymerase subunit sigma-70 [Phytoactinopolyspora halophila]